VKQLACALVWVAMVALAVWRARVAVRGSGTRDQTMFITFYSLFFGLPLVIILLWFRLTPLGVVVGVPLFLPLVLLCQQGFRFWVKLWYRAGK